MTTKISADNIQPATLASIGGGPKISQIIICDSSYTDLDDTAVVLSGGYIKIIGSGFKTGATVTVNKTPASSVTFISATEIRAQVGAQTAGSYIVYVVNSDGGVALRVNGLTYSSEPTWVSSSPLTNSVSGTSISIQLAATGAATFALQAGSTLPTGLTLSSGGLISGTVTVSSETLYNFTIVATDAELQDSPRAFSITITAGDVYFNSTTLLLSGNANTFVQDASTNNFAVTVAGDTKPNNFNPYTPGYYSVNFVAKTDYISTPAVTNLTTFASDFTFEAWIYPTDVTITYWGIWDSRQSGATAQAMILGLNPLAAAVSGRGRLTYYNGTNNYGTGIVYYNQWTHIAFVRSGTTLTFYIDGVAGGTATISGTQTGTATTNPIYIGSKDNGLAGYGSIGYLSNFRIVNGTAVYTSNFTPSTVPLTAITNTVLLTAQSNRFIDNSSNNYALTRVGTANISGFDSFVPNTTYASYGSAYFDGTGDVLTLSANAALGFGTGDFTVELWYYTTVAPTSTNVCLYNNGTSNFFLQLRSTAFGIGQVNTAENNVFSFNFVAGQWYHIAVARSGSTVQGFVNGVLAGSGSNSINYGQSGATIGGLTSSSQLITGYISNLRVVKGTAVYTANFTPPTQPLTAVAGTSLLTLQNNVPVANNTFLDSSSNNLLVTRAGNATQGTFSPYSPSGWSYFNSGTGNTRLSIANNAALQFGTGDFTVEFWAYITGQHPTDFYTGFLSFGGVYGTANTCLEFTMAPNGGFAVVSTTNTTQNFYVNLIAGNSGLLFNRWHHFAVSRSGTTVRGFTDGELKGTVTGNSTNINGTGIGAIMFQRLDSAVASTPGYLSNARAIKGTAVYTAAFTPPTQPLTAVAGTSLLTCADNRFVDESLNNLAITRTGNTRVTNFSPFKAVVQTPQTYSAYFDGTGDYLTIPSNSAFAFGTSAYTVEAWVYLTAFDSFESTVFAAASSAGGFAFSILPTGRLQLNKYGTGNIFQTNAGLINLNTWYHIAISRTSTSSNSAYLFINGSLAATGTDVENWTVSSSPTIGGFSNLTTYDIYGYISNLRVVRGTALYTNAFTPATQPLTAITNTSLLTCQSPTFIDNSTNKFAIAVSGNSQPVTVNPFGSTFVNSTEYTAAEYGGSMYFDGTGDYLATPDNVAFSLGTNDFTFECWVYPTAITAGNNNILVQWVTGGLAFIFRYVAAGRVSFSSGTTTVTGTTTAVVINQWNHIAITRASGTIRLFANGVLDATTGTIASSPDSTSQVTVGAYSDGTSEYITGYISNLRLIKGTSIYTSSFVPPLAPVLPVQNTVLLLDGTSAAITDATTKNDLETVGNAIVSTAVSKFGGSSMYFTGGGASYVQTPVDQPAFGFGTGDFTVELWINPTAGVSYIFFDTRRQNESRINLGLTTNSAGIQVSVGTTSIIAVTSGITPGAWNHIAVTRASGSLRLFINGTQAGATTSMTTDLGVVGSPCLATAGDARGNAAYGYTGYIQDVRVTRGIARYTANFTAPTTAFRGK